MTIANRIATKGFGSSRGTAGYASPVTQGYGGPPRFVVEAIRRGIKTGQSGRKRALREMEEVVAWAKLISINDNVSSKNIEGTIRVRVDRERLYAVLVEHVQTTAKVVIDGIKVFARLLVKLDN